MKILRIIGILASIEFTYHYFATATDQPQKYICLIMVALSITLATFKPSTK